MELGSRNPNIFIFFLILTGNIIFCAKGESYRLPRTVIPNSYIIRITIQDLYYENYSGTEVISFKTLENLDNIQIHSSSDYINIIRISLNGDMRNPCSWNYSSPEILTISCNRTIVPDQEHSIIIDYESFFSTQDQYGFYKVYHENKDEVILLTKLSPTFARRVFPCFDEPTFKAVFNFFVTHPQTHRILGNTPVITQINSTGGLVSQFDQTPMMSTYSIGFIISKHMPAIEELSEGEFVYNVFTNPALKDFAKTNLVDGRNLVNAMGEWTGTKYNEMGNIQLCSITVENLKNGVVNNWGLLVNREENVLDEGANTTAKQKQIIILESANQIAYQWFGSYISLNWWSNTWLNEGFAKFFAYYISNKVNDEFELENQFVVNVLQNTLYEDSILNMELSINEDNLGTSDILSKFNNMVANKGAIIIRMMESILGKEEFRKNMIVYINKAKFNTTNPTLLLESLNLVNLMDSYLYNPGYPLVTVRLDENQQSASIYQEPFYLIDETHEETYWYIPISYTTGVEKKFTNNDIHWFKNNVTLSLPIHSEAWIILNTQQIGYYRVNYDSELWNRIIHTLKGPQRSDIDVINRAQLIDDIFALARIGKVDYKNAFLLISYIEHESDYYPWVAALKVMQTLINQLNDEDTIALLKKTILNWINTSFPNLHEISSNRHIEILKQNLIISWKCFLGELECLNGAKNKYEEHKKSKTFQNYNERDIVLCYGVKSSAKAIDEYSYLMKLYQDSIFRIEKEILLSSLGCSSDKDILKIFLKEIVLDISVIPKYDAMKVFEAVASNGKVGVDAALEFLIENVSTLKDKYLGVFSIADSIAIISDKISTWSQFDKLKTLIETFEELQDNSSIRSLVIIENNLQWADNFTSTIKYILEHPPSSGSAVHPEALYLFLLLLIISHFLV